MRKQVNLILLLILFAINSFGQTTYTRTFSYDTNGNRIAYRLSFSKMEENGKVSPGEESFLSSATDTMVDLTVRIYPNPTHDKVLVSTAGNEAMGVIRVVLMTATGAVLEEKAMGHATESFDLTDRAPGLYLLEISHQQERHTWKVLKR